MLYIITPCSRPGLLDLVYESMPKENNIHYAVYAEECSKNGPIITLNQYLSYYNYLR